MDMTNTVIPKSDQQNYDDYLTGPKIVTIEKVTTGSAEQPVEIHIAEFPGRPYKPSKSMRRVLVAVWGPETSVYIGRRMKLVGDPTVKFGGVAIGGIKIAALSDIDKQLKLSLTASKGKREPHIVEPLTDPAPTAAPPLTERITKMVAAFDAQGITVDQLETRVGNTRDNWTAADIDAMTAVYQQLKAGGDKAELFPTDPTFPEETP